MVVALYIHDAFTDTLESMDGFNALLTILRGHIEYLKKFARRFSTVGTKFNALSSMTKITQCLITAMSLSSAHLVMFQFVSFFAAAVLSSDVFTDHKANDEFFFACHLQAAFFNSEAV